MSKNIQKGFTLLELIIVVSILVLVFSILFVILDPSRRVSETRNTQRQSDMHTLGEAIKTFQIDNGGPLPSGVDSSLRLLGTDSTGCIITCSDIGTTENSCIDISSEIAQNYVASIPKDPLTGTSQKTNYAVRTYGTSGIEIISCTPELGEKINYIR